MVRERSDEFREAPRSGIQRRASLSTELQEVRSAETGRYRKLQRSVEKKPGFFRRHPVLTTLGVAAGAYFAAPWLARLWAGAERAGAGVAVNRIGQAIRSVAPLGPRMRPAPGMEFMPGFGA